MTVIARNSGGDPVTCHPRAGGDPAILDMSKKYFVYILANRRNGTLYIGITNNLVRRIYEHKNGLVEGFTKTYNVYLLVYYEEYNEVRNAIEREKILKKWNRKWKIRIIEKTNPEWNDLYDELKPF